jgi:hypothetical protein
MDFFRKLLKPKNSSAKKRSKSASSSRSVGGRRRSRSSSRSRGRGRSRARYVGGAAELSPADFSTGSDSSASEYMLKTVGNLSDQINNAGNTNTIHPLSGGRHKGGKHRGGFMGEVLRQGVVPAALVGMSLYKGKGLHSGKPYRNSRSRTRKSH